VDRRLRGTARNDQDHDRLAKIAMFDRHGCALDKAA
jgi:hypothetical protein